MINLWGREYRVLLHGRHGFGPETIDHFLSAVISKAKVIWCNAHDMAYVTQFE